MITLCIIPQSGISADGFDVVVENEGMEQCLFNKSYRYGYDASYSKENAEAAHADAEKAKKYGWKSSYYKERPFVTDILRDLVAEYSVTEIYLAPGVHKFNDTPFSQKELDKFCEKYVMTDSSLSELINTRVA